MGHTITLVFSFRHIIIIKLYFWSEPMKLDELTVIDYVINQIKSAKKCNKIIIATTNFSA